MNFNSSGRIKTSVLAKMARLNASVLREDGRIERMCNHGIGHTVGNAADTPRGEYFWSHGCDGCCTGWEKDDGTVYEALQPTED